MLGFFLFPNGLSGHNHNKKAAKLHHGNKCIIECIKQTGEEERKKIGGDGGRNAIGALGCTPQKATHFLPPSLHNAIKK